MTDRTKTICPPILDLKGINLVWLVFFPSYKILCLKTRIDHSSFFISQKRILVAVSITRQCFFSFLNCVSSLNLDNVKQRVEHMVINKQIMQLFVCLLGVNHSRFFYWYGDVTVTSEGLQIFTYARHTWPLCSERSLACHANCDKGHAFIMVIFEDPWHLHILPSVWQWSCHYLFLRLTDTVLSSFTSFPSIR